MAKDPTTPLDASAAIIPFGKHKGKTVAELLVTDPQYADWVMAQSWFAQRFAELHATILARGAGSDDSPEHNALQVRFLHEEFRNALLRIATPTRVEEAFQKFRELLVEDASYEINLHDRPKPHWETVSKERAEKARNRMARIIGGEMRLASVVKFERAGIDVLIEFKWIIETFEESSAGKEIGVELKPSIGDDYPAVLRQMQRLGCVVCVAEKFSGRGVSEAQLRQMFEANGFAIVFIREIEEAVAKSVTSIGEQN